MKSQAGAFATGMEPSVAGPAPTAAPDDPGMLLERLKSLGFLEGSGPSSGPAPAQAPMAAEPPGLDPLDALTKMAQIPAAPPMPPRPTKRTFTPGVRQEPQSGYTASQLLNNPGFAATLEAKIAQWREANPGKQWPKGPDIKKLVPGVSDAQARTLVRQMQRRQMKQMVSDVDLLLRKGAGAALKGDT